MEKIVQDILKAFTRRFVLDVLKSRKFLNPVMSIANGRCPGRDYIIT